MSTALTVNGVTYNYPASGDENWATDASGWASAVTSGMLQKAGGSFTLTAEVDFGGSFGLKSLYLKSQGTNPASSGIVRLASTEAVSWRNNANSGNLTLATNASDQLLFNSIVLVDLSSSQTLTNKTLTTPIISTISGPSLTLLPGSSQDGDVFITPPTTNRIAVYYAQQASGSTTGAAYFCSLVAAGTKWSAGLDTPSGAYKIANTDGFGANVYLTIATNGATTIGGTLTTGSNAATHNSVVVGSSANTISGLSTVVNGSGTLTLPSTTSTLATQALSETFSNKTLDNSCLHTVKAANLTIQDGSDTTKQAKFVAASISTATTRSYTLPDVTDTLVTLTATQTLTNKTLTTPVISSISNTGTLTLPTSTDTLVGRATTDTLTNKTLTTPTINQPVIAGVTDGSDAAAGKVGEYMVSTVSAYTNTGADLVYFDCTSLSLTAGDWDVQGTVSYNLNGATVSGLWEVGITSTTGNSSAGENDTLNWVGSPVNPTGSENLYITSPQVRVSINSTTTYYLKGIAHFSAGQPRYKCTMRARRVR